MVSKNLIYLFICFHTFVKMCLSQDHVEGEDLHSFLRSRSASTNHHLLNLHKTDSYPKDFHIHVEFHTPQERVLEYFNSTVRIFSLLNNTYMFINSTTFDIRLDGDLTLNENAVIQLKENVSFVKTGRFTNLGFIMVAFPTYSQVYMFGSDWVYVQSISNLKQAMDAKFFIYRNNFYLVVVNNDRDAITSTIVYKWTGAYFDQTWQVFTKNAEVVASLSTDESEVIVILQNSSRDEHNLIVYELTQNGLKKKQILSGHDSNHIITYEFDKHEYLLVLGERKNSTLYWWDGSEFVMWMKFSNFENVKKILQGEHDKIPVIAVIQKDRLVLFSHSAKDLSLISNTRITENNYGVLDAQLISRNHTGLIFIATLTVKGQLKNVLIPYTMTFSEIEEERPTADDLLVCLRNLEKQIEITRGKLDRLDEPIKKIIRTNEPFQYEGRLRVANAVRADSVIVKSQISSTRSHQQASELKNKLERIGSKVNNLNPKLDGLFREGDQINGKIVVRGTLEAEDLQARNLYIQEVNGMKWAPDTWLSYSTPQTITGRMIFGDMNIQKLEVLDNNKILIDLVSSNQNHTPNSLPVLNSLTARNILVPKINDIPFQDLYLRSEPIIIQGIKKFDNIFVDQMSATYLNEKSMTEAEADFRNFAAGKVSFPSNLNVRNFNFETINGINWNVFKDSVFRIGVTSRITGNISMVSMTTNKLFTTNINGINPNKFLTTSTNQVVTSDLQIPNIHAVTLRCNDINGVDLENQAVTAINNVIRGPVSIKNMKVNGNLHIEGPAFSVQMGEDHIFGTNETDLLQIYNAKVKIVGDLHLSNVNFLESTEIIVNNQPFTGNLSNTYWLRSQNQVIPTHFEVQRGISTPHLTTTSLNDIPVTGYMLNTVEDKPFTPLVFENATILGNVLLNETAHHSPDLTRLNLESVKIEGSYPIRDTKTFQGKVKIKNLITNYLDGTKVADVLTSHYNGPITGKKSFENLIIGKNIVADRIDVTNLNNVDLKSLEDTVLYVDKAEQFNSLTFSDIAANNIFTSSINNHNFAEHLINIDHVYTTTFLNDVIVNGNVVITSAESISKINNYNFKDLLTDILHHNGDISIEHQIKLMGNIHANNVEVKYINDINFSELMKNVLYKNWDQNISAVYTFDKVNTQNVYVDQINDVLTQNLINTKNPNPQTLVSSQGVQLFAPKFKKSLTAETLPCDLRQAIENMQNPPSGYWKTVHVEGNITLLDTDSDIKFILQNAVNSKLDNLIKERVVFQHHVAVNFAKLNKRINSVYFNDLLEDAVLKTAEQQQIIDGRKRFIRLATGNAYVQGNADIPTINQIYDIVDIDRNIIPLSEIHATIIEGRKVFFGGLQGNRLIADQISGVEPKDLVSQNDVEIIPKASFQLLEIDNNLDVEYVNGLNMRNILKDRLLRFHDGPQEAFGRYYFQESLYFYGNATVTTINGVPVKDIVLDVDKQVILGSKSFKRGVTVNESIAVDLLNERNFSEIYSQAILLGQKNVITGNMEFKNEVVIIGDINTNSINGMLVPNIHRLMQSEAPEIETAVINNMTGKITNVIKRSAEMSNDMPNQYLYLEKSTSIQLSIPNSINAYVYTHTDQVTFYIIQRENGFNCGLPNDCFCPISHIVLITHTLSVNQLSKTYHQRTFTYDDGEVIIHVYTNTVSTSEFCRTNPTIAFNEATSLSFTTTFPNKTRATLFSTEKTTGYVSDVKFFKHDNNVYAVVSRYYDAIENTNDVECLVYEFLKQTGEISVVQTIKCSGAWTLTLFPTDQGTVLVIGNVLDLKNGTQETGSEIYRFNSKIKQFMLLRKFLSTGCNVAAGVVLGPDSLIITGHQISLQILKYHPVYDNYYFYQTILLQSPIVGMSVFYTKEFGTSDAYLTVTVESGNFYLYSFHYITGWQKVTTGEIAGLQNLVPFVLNNELYLLAVSTDVSSILTVVKQGST